VPASINSAVPPCQSHVTHNGVTREHAGALLVAARENGEACVCGFAAHVQRR